MKKLILFLVAILPIVGVMAQTPTVTTSYAHLSYCYDTQSNLDSVVGCGLPFYWHGVKVTGAGDWVATIPNAANCDSIMTLHLTVENWKSSSTIYDDICKGKTYSLNGHTYNTAGTYTQHVNNSRGCDSTITLVLTEKTCVPKGAINGLFTVGANKQVYFSKGNLQYQKSTGTWQFAEHQYPVLFTYYNSYNLGTYGKNADTNWMDLFGYGTAGNVEDPHWVTTDGWYPTEDISNTENDWGQHNAIFNGLTTDPAGTWRTLTKTEWNYLLNTRANADSKKGYAFVAGMAFGLVLLPDSWVLPSGLTFLDCSVDLGVKLQSYTAAEWDLMEANGAVFLPMSGVRVYESNKYCLTDEWAGYYWSSSYGSNGYAYFLYFDSVDMPETKAKDRLRYCGMAVRLVQ